MAQLRIDLDLDNAAFDPEPGPEVARILEHIASSVRGIRLLAPHGPDPMAIRDSNGNTVGELAITN